MGVIPIVDESKIKSPVEIDIPDDKVAGSILGLYETYWKDYLKKKNYNTDPNEMCRICQMNQIKKFGEITIECSGPKTVVGKMPDEIKANFSDEELDKIEQTKNPYAWADANIDIDQPDPDKRLFARRWHQEMMVVCSAKKKTIRCGRRAGKTFGLAIDIVDRLIKNENYQILVVTPFESQAKEITDTVRKLLRKINPEIGSWNSLVSQSVASPYQKITLKNGSTLKAFTAGNDGGSIRGQGANWLIIDEADFLTKAAFDSVIAILMDKKDTEFTCTSTPMGENILFKLSNSKEYKEFHFPSFVIPHYSDEMDKDLRSSTSVMGYIQEIQAEYGVADNAVFQTEFITRAEDTKLSAPIVDVLMNRQDYILILGCDWNADKVGTRICIVAYSKKEDKVFVCSMDNVRKEGWTQVAAVEKIKELNRQYIPDFIFVDEGFGEANVQQLKLVALDSYGKLPKDHPDLRLANVQPVNFSSTLDLVDVVTGEIRKKYYKNFMVETVKRMLEKGLISLNNKLAEPIVEQMKGYVVKSRNASGREIYEAKNPEVGDHDLDAFMIAVCGLHMKYESILDTRRYSEYTILPFEKQTSKGYNSQTTIEKRKTTDELSRDAKKLYGRAGLVRPSSGRAGKLITRSSAYCKFKDYRSNMSKTYR